MLRRKHFSRLFMTLLFLYTDLPSRIYIWPIRTKLLYSCCLTLFFIHNPFLFSHVTLLLLEIFKFESLKKSKQSLQGFSSPRSSNNIPLRYKDFETDLCLEVITKISSKAKNVSELISFSRVEGKKDDGEKLWSNSLDPSPLLNGITIWKTYEILLWGKALIPSIYKIRGYRYIVYNHSWK